MIDTDVLIWAFRGKAKATDFLNTNQGFFISIITNLELIQGTFNKQELHNIKLALKIRQTQNLPVNNEISQEAIGLAENYFHSHALGITDALIAATAIHFNLPLVTGSIKHVAFLKSKGLRVVPFRIN
ncbi:MAG: type II toxin-antitoxin system VapC family toxin [Magnetococcales bacterium]|nr:type II toxin-antitoxin system VapC family toxin [Magnetococcales bacterium]